MEILVGSLGLLVVSMGILDGSLGLLVVGLGLLVLGLGLLSVDMASCHWFWATRCGSGVIWYRKGSNLLWVLNFLFLAKGCWFLLVSGYL